MKKNDLFELLKKVKFNYPDLENVIDNTLSELTFADEKKDLINDENDAIKILRKAGENPPSKMDPEPIGIKRLEESITALKPIIQENKLAGSQAAELISSFRYSSWGYWLGMFLLFLSVLVPIVIATLQWVGWINLKRDMSQLVGIIDGLIGILGFIVERISDRKSKKTMMLSAEKLREQDYDEIERIKGKNKKKSVEKFVIKVIKIEKTIKGCFNCGDHIE